MMIWKQNIYLAERVKCSKLYEISCKTPYADVMYLESSSVCW